MKVSALILAGTRPGGDPLAREQEVSHKGLIDIAGLPMIERVIGALSDAGCERIAVATDDEDVAVIARENNAEVIMPGSGPSASAAHGFTTLGTPCLITTSDHALLRPEWVRKLIERTPATADVGIMLARRDRVEAVVPESRRTYLKFADGEWSGCNLFYLRTERARAAIDVWQKVEADRKRPWRIAARLGPATLLLMLARRLTLAEGIQRLGKRIDIEAALVPATDGLAAIDVDKPADLALVRQLYSSYR